MGAEEVEEGELEETAGPTANRRRRNVFLSPFVFFSPNSPTSEGL